MFREEMGDKPYLQIEVDEQYSAVGIITLVPMDDTVMQKHWNWVKTAAVS